MSAVSGEIVTHKLRRAVPLLAAADSARPIFWRDGEPIDSEQFLVDVERTRQVLPAKVPILNLCEGRYEFVVAFAAVMANGQHNLLPPSRAPQAIDEILAAHPQSVAVAGRDAPDLPAGSIRLPACGPGSAAAMPMIRLDQCVAVGHTSGSTGRPSAHRKLWGQLLASNARNMAALRPYLGDSFQVVATVPPQHMYGLEMSLLLPLAGAVSVASEMPLYAADVAAAIAAVPAPRVLVTTPLHLRMLLDAGIPVPALAAIVSATAPLAAELAQRAEKQTGARVVEVFGSTETCVFASRVPTHDLDWRLYDDVEVHARPDGTRVVAPWLPADVLLADLIEQTDPRHFRLRGRSADLLEIAGKRASLADLSRRLLAIPGVEDGVVFQPDDQGGNPARRLAALVVAPQIGEREILARLRRQIDPVFLPRPLRRVAQLPRNGVGKLPREALLGLLERERR